MKLTVSTALHPRHRTATFIRTSRWSALRGTPSFCAADRRTPSSADHLRTSSTPRTLLKKLHGAPNHDPIAVSIRVRSAHPGPPIMDTTHGWGMVWGVCL